MNTYLLILLIIFVVIVVTYIEYKITKRRIKFSINCPKTFTEIEYDGHRYLFYKVKYKNDVVQKIKNNNVYQYKITPQITIPQRFKILLNNSRINTFNINNVITSIVPGVANIFDLLTTTQKSNYRILTTNPDISAITDEHQIHLIQ